MPVGDAAPALSGHPAAHELCGAELGRFTAAAAGPDPLLVACTQEAPTFQRAQADGGGGAPLAFFNIREAAGWSDEADQAQPKIAALIAAAVHDANAPARGPVADVTLQSEGVTVVYGCDDRAVEAAWQLKDHLDLTVIITGSADLEPPRTAEFPVVRGTLTRVTGHLGAFDLVVDGFAEPLPDSRSRLLFGPARNGARSRCDVIIDLSGGLPLVPGWEHREGYLRASPDDPMAVQRALFTATDLVGTFTKPRYINFHPSRCAHQRSGQVGCTRCLDACPAGAITPAGDSVAISAHICAGCGTCAAVCPTTAAEYAVPTAEAAARRLRTLLAAYRDADGTAPPVLLLHDATHGAPLIEALARHGRGLPARVIPLPMAGQPGLDLLATAFAFGAAEVRLLAGRRDADRRAAHEREVELLSAILGPLGYGEGRVAVLEADDPDMLDAALRGMDVRNGVPPAAYLPTGDKNALTMQALNALHAAAPAPADALPLPRGAPIGRVHIKSEGCTLCLSCVAVCPTAALRDNPERPMVRFIEDLCVQCGLCATTCPENVVHLEPRATFGAARRNEVILNEEPPAICIRCAKPFGTQSSIEKVAAQLEGKHWMFRDPAIADRIRMCGDCRMVDQARAGLDPYAGAPRPRTRMTDDYR